MPATIRSRLLLLVLAVLLPAILGVMWLIARTFDTEREAHVRSLRDTARALARVVDIELAQRVSVARVLAQSHHLDRAPDVPPEELRQFERLARRAMMGFDGWIELRDPRTTLVDSRLPLGTLPPASDAPSGEGLVGVPMVHALRTSTPARDAHAALVEPVQRDGRTLLNLMIALRPVELQDIIDKQQLPPDWIAAVIDTEGAVVARHPGGTDYTGRRATADIRESIAREREGLFRSVSLDGVPTIGFYSTGTRGWTFLAAMPQAQYTGNVPTAVVQVILGAVALLALAVAGAMWVSRDIVGSVNALKAMAARMQAGLPVDRQLTGIAEHDEVASALSVAAQTMQRNRGELERQVANAVTRTREAEQRVSQSQRVEALGRLTGGVAHDFNNLLGIISNSAHLIQRHAGTPELQGPVAATLRAVEVGSRLTQHLMRVAGRRPVRPRTLHLASYLEEVRELLQSVLGRHVAISVQVEADCRPVHVDAGELELAMINLALNARDAMSGGGELRLHARNASGRDAGVPDGHFVLIACSDDGIGMDPDLAARVFEPFFTTKVTGKGTGLGLSQVHGFCVQAGGTARVQSTPGRGTTVQLFLPAADQDTKDPVLPVREDPPSLANIAGSHVLLVEDNLELGDVTAALLEDHGSAVRRAADAAEALQALADDPSIDVVLSDVVMPGHMDGLAMARQLRQDRPGLPVVLITGYSNSAAAANDHVVLRKPYTVESLLRALGDALASRVKKASSSGASGLQAEGSEPG